MDNGKLFEERTTSNHESAFNRRGTRQLMVAVAEVIGPANSASTPVGGIGFLVRHSIQISRTVVGHRDPLGSDKKVQHTR